MRERKTKGVWYETKKMVKDEMAKLLHKTDFKSTNNWLHDLVLFC